MEQQVSSLAGVRDSPFARQLERQLFRLVRSYESCDRSCLTRHEVTAGQGYALLALPAEGGMSMSELSAAMGMAGSTMTYIVDELVAKGLVQRAPGKEDRRVVHVTLSERGRALREEMEASLQDVFARVLDEIAEKDRGPLLHALSEITRAIASVAGRCCPR